MSALMGFAFLAVLAIAYFFPSINASKRRHRNAPAIMALNFFLGWTMLGWVAALVWSLTDNVRNEAVSAQTRLSNGYDIRA